MGRHDIESDMTEVWLGLTLCDLRLLAKLIRREACLFAKHAAEVGLIPKSDLIRDRSVCYALWCAHSIAVRMLISGVGIIVTHPVPTM